MKPGWKPKTCGSAAPSQLAPPCAALSAVFSDAEAAKNGDPHQIFTGALWPRSQDADPLLTMWETFAALHDPTGIWTFWRDWYRGMLTGAPMDWDLQQPMALIKDEIWKAGPEDVAKEIERIRKTFNPKDHKEKNQPNKDPVTAGAAETMAKRLQMNRDAISLTSASLLEQIAEFREKVRGNNYLDADFRDQLLSFLDQLTADFHSLIGTLPASTKTPDTKAGENAVRWLRDFKAHFFKEAVAYTAPENVATATIPTGIILGCTAVGSLVGMPVAGTVVGGLLTGQLKPGKAADELLQPKSTGND
ncbi:hypothetical protein [Pseudophaeobacter sp.]|uniref:hypothetical protein n=1 Tax=Pseudophaeobacter sp. TaxID=1971739 RepID=UPI003267182E